MPTRPDDARRPGRRTLGPPPKQGLYDPWFEHDSCGVGFVVDIKGRKSNQILKQAIQILKSLDHRGAAGSEANTGDGAGVLIQMPHAFRKDACRKIRIALPEPGEYGCGLVFLPRDRIKRPRLGERFEEIVPAEGQTQLSWRPGPPHPVTGPMAFERKLLVIRKHAYNEIRTSTMDGAEYWYVASLSFKTIVYKGMLLTEQLEKYYTDLQRSKERRVGK